MHEERPKNLISVFKSKTYLIFARWHVTSPKSPTDGWRDVFQCKITRGVQIFCPHQNPTFRDGAIHYRLREHRHDKYICNIFILRFQMAPLGGSMEMQRSLCTWERIYCTRGNLKIVKKIVKLTSTENVLYASKQIMD